MSARVVHINDRIEGAVYIGRRNYRSRLPEHPLHNPYAITKWQGRAEVIAKFKWYLEMNRGLCRHLPELRGKPLACWCRHDGEEKTDANECHGDVLIEFLDRFTDDELRAMAEES
jgi:hypothetical protein